MPKDSLCLLPPVGYNHKNRRYSKESMAWLAWIERKWQLTDLRTARKAYEVKINGHYVDGTGVDPAGHRHVFEFHGCYYHGCRTCYTDRTPILDVRLQRTMALDTRMAALGVNPASPYGPFTYHVIWECQLKQQKKREPELKDFIRDYMAQFCWEPLCPRDSLRGGRTEAIKHKVFVNRKTHRLYYVDFTR